MQANETEHSPATNFRRIEEKLRLSLADAQSLYQTLAAKMSADEFIPGQSVSEITTLYCDGVELPFFRSAKSGGARNRVRVRMYGVWDDPTEPYAWLEWKLSPPKGEEGFTTKRRFRISRGRLSTFFSAPPSVEEIRAFQKNKNADDAEDCYLKLMELSDGLGLQPLVASHYKRRALLLGEGSDRITFDFDLGYSLVSWSGTDLRLSDTVMDDAVIVECKHASPVASWVGGLLQRFPKASGFSKFERALELRWLSREENNADRL